MYRKESREGAAKAKRPSPPHWVRLEQSRSRPPVRLAKRKTGVRRIIGRMSVGHTSPLPRSIPRSPRLNPHYFSRVQSIFANFDLEPMSSG